MGKINYGRVVIGGLLAGVVISIGEFILNMYVIADSVGMFMEQHSLPAQSSGIDMMWGLANFVIGISIVFLYALIRPRCGAGAKTAAQAGLFVWILVWLVAFGGVSLTIGMPGGMIVTSLLWGLVEVVLGALAGGWVYKEEDAAAPAAT